MNSGGIFGITGGDDLGRLRACRGERYSASGEESENNGGGKGEGSVRGGSSHGCDYPVLQGWGESWRGGKVIKAGDVLI